MIIDLTVNVPANSPMRSSENFQKNKLAAMGHIGTHLDTYEKVAIPLEYFRSEGVFFDVRGIKEVQVEDIRLEKVKEGSFVIFRTGQIENNPYGEKSYFHNHPQLSKELIEKLVEKKIRFIGIDASGVRQHEEHEPTDRFCEKKGVYIIENLQNLNLLPDGRFTVYTMWLDDPEMTGLRCRVIAES